jgi:hypothetical protein
MAMINEMPKMGDTPPTLIVKWTPVEIDSGDTPWCTIFLADGNKLRIQINVSSILRNDAVTGPDGMPEYNINATMNVQAFPRKQRK